MKKPNMSYISFFFFFLIAIGLAGQSVFAIDWTSEPGWVTRANERLTQDQKVWNGHESFTPRPIVPCVVKENAYPNGTVFYRVWGIEGSRSDGSTICYVPHRGGGKKKDVVKTPTYTSSSSCDVREVCEETCESERDWVCHWESRRVCNHHGCFNVPYRECGWETTQSCTQSCENQMVCDT